MWTRYHHCHLPSPGSQSQHVKMGSAVRRGLGSPFLCVLTCGGDGPRCLAMMPSLLRTRGAPRSSGNPQKLSSRPAPFTACPIRVHGLPHPRHGHTPRPDGIPFRPRRASVACRPAVLPPWLLSLPVLSTEHEYRPLRMLPDRIARLCPFGPEPSSQMLRLRQSLQLFASMSTTRTTGSPSFCHQLLNLLPAHLSPLPIFLPARCGHRCSLPRELSLCAMGQEPNSPSYSNAGARRGSVPLRGQRCL